MFTLNDDLSIYATRGDIVFFKVGANEDGEPYSFKAGDVVRIKVFGKKDAENVVLQKDFPITENTQEVDIFLSEEDTKIGEVISKPRDYWYEIELNPYNNPQTIIGYDEDGAKIFRLFPEGADFEEIETDPKDIPVVDERLDLTSIRPVQNHAIAREVFSLSAELTDAKKEFRAEIENAESVTAQNTTDIAAERARIDNLASGATSDDSEVIDIRVGCDGTVYDSAGTAVRQQFNNLKGYVNSKCKRTYQLFNKYGSFEIKNYYLTNDNAVTTHDNYKSLVIPVSLVVGKTYVINALKTIFEDGDKLWLGMFTEKPEVGSVAIDRQVIKAYADDTYTRFAYTSIADISYLVIAMDSPTDTELADFIDNLLIAQSNNVYTAYREYYVPYVDADSLTEDMQKEYNEVTNKGMAESGKVWTATADGAKWSDLPLKKLTITGDVTAEYDGSKEVVLKIEKGTPTDSQVEESVKGWFNKNPGLISNNRETGADVALGDEIADKVAWDSIGWSGDFLNGYKHTVGKTTPLTANIGAVKGDLYLVEFDVETPSPAGVPNDSTAFTVTIGDSPRFITYKGAGPDHYSFGILAGDGGAFSIVPCAPADPFTDEGNFDGTVKNISIKLIKSKANTSVTFIDKDGNVAIEGRVTDRNNVYLGKGTGLSDISGERNVAIGANSFENNTTGFWNVAIGSETLQDNTVGSRNVAIGRLALNRNQTGDRNYAIGTYALMRNVSGRFNVAIGADALWNTENGNGNIALGSACLSELTEGNNNVAIGRSTGNFESGEENVAIGYLALGTATNPKSCVAIGRQALYKNTTGEGNVAIGHSALGVNTSGYNNVAVGRNALSNITTGRESVAVGSNAGTKQTAGNGSVFLGAWAGYLNTGANNVFVGYNAGKDNTTGSNNIVIGKGCQTPNATDSNTIVIGSSVHSSVIVAGKKIYFNEDGTVTWEEV